MGWKEILESVSDRININITIVNAMKNLVSVIAITFING